MAFVWEGLNNKRPFLVVFSSEKWYIKRPKGAYKWADFIIEFSTELLRMILKALVVKDF